MVEKKSIGLRQLGKFSRKKEEEVEMLIKKMYVGEKWRKFEMKK